MPLEFHRGYLTRLPLPLAQLYRRAYNDKDARSRHDNAFYSFEALIKLAACPLVTAYLDDARRSGVHVEDLDRLLLRLALPSLGQWLNILRALAGHFASLPDAASHPLGHVWTQLTLPHCDQPDMLALYRRIKNGPDGTPSADSSCSLLQLLDALVQYRNGVFGHGATRFESFYEHDMGPMLFPALNEVLVEGFFDLLGPPNTRLVYLTELRVLADDRYELAMRELLGEQSERLSPQEVSAAQIIGLAPHHVAVLWPGRQVPLRLDPLLLFRESEMGDEILFLNRDRNGRQVEYLSYTTGRTERDRSQTAALATLLTTVTGQPITEARLQRLAEQSLAETPSIEQLQGEAQPITRQIGDYELLAEIGRGGMGVVYLARQLSLGRRVAVKMLPADLAGDEVTLARFRREMRALARCDHPNIVKVLNSGMLPDGRWYYTMEYVPGCDLEQVWRELSQADGGAGTARLGNTTFIRAVLSASIKKRQEIASRHTLAAEPASTTPLQTEADAPRLPLQPLPMLPEMQDDPGGYTRRVVVLIRDAALALQAVHDQQIVHRDVKPANLMLTSDGARVVLMDFGLVKGQSLSLSLTQAGGFLGTLRYAAPEQLAAAMLQVGPQADVRGLGVTLWELLTRRRLFVEAEDELQLASKIHEEDVPLLRQIDPSFDRDLEAIVARATERRTADRLASAGQFAEYLQLYLDGKPLPIRPPSTAELVRRWMREHQTLVSSVAAAVVLLTFTVIVAFIAVTRAKNDAVAARDDATGLAKHNKKLAESEEQARQKAEASSQQAQQRLTALYTEQGRKELLQGNPSKAVVYLSEAYQSGATGPVLRLLLADAMRPIDAQLASLEGHTGAVRSARFSPDGTRVLTTAEDDKTVKLWETATGRLLASLEGHTDTVDSAQFSPDGTRVLTASRDGTAKLWDVHLETRSPAEIAALVYCRAPWRLDEGRLVPTTSDATACPPRSPAR